MLKTLVRKIIAAIVNELKSHNDPREIALGMAIGTFIAILPLYGLHTLLCVGAALLIPRANKIGILLGTNISLPPSIALITWTAYDIGRYLLPSRHYPPLSWEYVRHFSIARISEFYQPLFIGSVALGLICATVVYLLTWAIAGYFRKKYFRPGA